MTYYLTLVDNLIFDLYKFDGQSVKIMKVPLIIFKREKKIARRLELDTNLYSQDEGGGWFERWWDSFVVQSPSFPQQYWDKQVKWRVRNGLSEDVQCRID